MWSTQGDAGGTPARLLGAGLTPLRAVQSRECLGTSRAGSKRPAHLVSQRADAGGRRLSPLDPAAHASPSCSPPVPIVATRLFRTGAAPPTASPPRPGAATTVAAAIEMAAAPEPMSAVVAAAHAPVGRGL